MRIRLLLLLFFLSPVITAQEFKTVNISKGLPSKEVYDILEDRRGYIWFATDRGVARYDGKNFKTYTRSDGLRDNTIFRMCEDHKGRIWFGSQSNELCYWYRDSIHFLPSSAKLSSMLLSSEFINKLYADSSDNLWINFRQTLFFSEAKKNYSTFKQIHPDSNSTYEIRVVEDQVPFCMIPKTLKYYDETRTAFWNLKLNFRKDQEPSQIHRYNFPLSEAYAPVARAFFAYSKKLNTYYLAMNDHLISSTNNQLKGQVLPGTIIQIFPDQNGDVWIGLSKKGVAFYKNGDLSKPPITLLNGCSVDDILIDHEGGIWLATLEKGVFYIPSKSVTIYQNQALNDRIVFIGEIDQKIYTSTGTAVFEGDYEGFKPVDILTELVSTRGKMFYLKKFMDTIYANYGGELVRYHQELKPENKIPQKNIKFQGEFAGGKMQLQTADNRLWLVDGGGIKSVNTQTCKTFLYRAPFRVTTAIANGNDILLGGKKGLYLFRGRRFSNLSKIHPLLKSQIIEIAMDNAGYLWIATVGEGVLRFKNNTLKQITENQGLISNICTSVAVDVYGNVWVGTNKGISCIQCSDAENDQWKIKNLDEQNGLNSDDITRLFCHSNTVWAGTMSGISCIDIFKTLSAIPPAPVYIDSVKVNGAPVSSKNTFLYKENNFLFKLHSLTFKDNGDHLYRYRLIGQDTTWQEFKSDELLLNNLLPGKYTFQVQVANLDKIWSTVPASYSFTINKPFWLTWWFIAIEMLVVIAIIYLIILWRTHIIKQKEAEKLRINKLLAEYQMKALTAQMNPHFIFNAINSIQNFIIQNHSTLAYDYLIKFSKLIRLVLNNSNEKEISIQQELDTLAIYIELEQLRFKDSFQYKLIIDPGLELDSLMIPSLLLQPYIENAIWHGLMPLKTRKGMIILSIQQEKELLKIDITDNGVGRKASDQLKKKIRQNSHRSVGMELTGKRIELFGQENQFSIQVTDNYDENNNSTGTTVEIILPMIEMY